MIPYLVFLPIITALISPLGVEIWPGVYQNHPADFQLLPISYVRTYIRWSEIELSPGVYTWQQDFDQTMAALSGRRIVVSIHDTPKFYLPSSETRTCAPPSVNNQDNFLRFVREVVARYPKVMVWEMWNEPEFPEGGDGYFGCWGSYGGTFYGQYLADFYKTVKDVNPSAKVMFGSVSADSSTQFFVDAMNAGAKFDLLGIHVYSVEGTPFDVTVTKGDKWRAISPAPVWITETSHLCYSNCGDEFEQHQADWLKVVRGMTTVYPVIIWYGLDDSYWLESGMYNRIRKKPVWFEYQNYLIP